MMSTLRLIVQPIAIAIALAVAVRASSIGFYSIPSSSMEPALQIGDTILVTPYVRGERPQRGDVIVFRSPASQNEMVVKRVIAVPGDHLELRDQRIVVGGHTVAEPYAIGNRTPGFIASQIVAPDRYFVLGDNRPNSYDSRQWGAIAGTAIAGRARLILWSARDLAPAREASATSLTSGKSELVSAMRFFKVIR